MTVGVFHFVTGFSDIISLLEHPLFAKMLSANVLTVALPYLAAPAPSADSLLNSTHCFLLIGGTSTPNAGYPVLVYFQLTARYGLLP